MYISLVKTQIKFAQETNPVFPEMIHKCNRILIPDTNECPPIKSHQNMCKNKDAFSYIQIWKKWIQI